MSEGKEPSSETRSAGQGQLSDFKTKLNTSYWSALRNRLLETWENIWQFEDEYKLVSQMSAEEFSVWASAHEDFVKQFLDEQSDIDDIRKESKEAGERIASLWAKCPAPFRIIFSKDDPDKVVYSPIDFPPDLDRVIRELHEKYPSCDWNEPFILDCIAILHFEQMRLQRTFLPMLEQLTAGKDVSADRVTFYMFIHETRCWLDDYNTLNDVCRIHSEMKVLSDAIAEMERVNANTTTLEKMKNDLQQNLNAMMGTLASQQKTNASQQETIASQQETIARLQRQADETLPQIQHDVSVTKTTVINDYEPYAVTALDTAEIFVESMIYEMSDKHSRTTFKHDGESVETLQKKLLELLKEKQAYYLSPNRTPRYYHIKDVMMALEQRETEYVVKALKVALLENLKRKSVPLIKLTPLKKGDAKK